MTHGLTFRPVTSANVGDFETLFGAPGAPKYCWCMAWRATSAELKDASSASRHRQIVHRITHKEPVGLLAYIDGAPVGWVSLAPKASFRGLGGPQADEGVWSLTCMFVAKQHRKSGLSGQLITEAASHARKKGASLLEAYPVDADSPSYRHMGFVPAFARLGFIEVARAGTRRHVMQLSLAP